MTVVFFYRSVDFRGWIRIPGEDNRSCNGLPRSLCMPVGMILGVAVLVPRARVTTTRGDLKSKLKRRR